jgi:hypothetical protein
MSLLPVSIDENLQCVDGVIELVEGTEAPEELRVVLKDRVYPQAKTAKTDRGGLLTAQSNFKAANVKLHATDDKADGALSHLYAAMGIRGGVAGQNMLRGLWGGLKLTDVKGLNVGEQVRVVGEAIVRYDANPELYDLPVERLEEVRTTNADLGVAYTEERAAKRAWTLASVTSEASMDAFGQGYRSAVRLAVALLGEAVVTAHLPVFVR